MNVCIVKKGFVLHMWTVHIFPQKNSKNISIIDIKLENQQVEFLLEAN